MGRTIALGTGILFLVLALAYILVSDGGVIPRGTIDTGLARLSIDGTPIRIAIADTDAERIRGLSGQITLPPNQGMLFIFESDDYYAIWMKDMNFPLDIYWLNTEGVVVDMRTNVAPETYPDVFRSKRPARYVLEMPAGFSEQYNIGIGSKVDL